MFKSKMPEVTISIPQNTLDEIFDECDRFDSDETGGRIIGTYARVGGNYQIKISGLITAGPRARRSPTSFFQDGEFQESEFRKIEERQPDIEHLGNWHTHHVNGLRSLSSGDRATYRRIVSHPQHNTDFFYALLVVEKLKSKVARYETKHYVLFRGDDNIYEVPPQKILVQSDPNGYENQRSAALSTPDFQNTLKANSERAKDQEFFAEAYPLLHPIFSRALSAICWKGELPLINGANAKVVIVEDPNSDQKPYTAAVVETPKHRDWEIVEGTHYKSARQAVLALERALNKSLYSRKGDKQE